jgi:hypothetical protein
MQPKGVRPKQNLDGNDLTLKQLSRFYIEMDALKNVLGGHQ